MGTSPKAPTCPDTLVMTSTLLLLLSTVAPARPSAGRHPRRRLVITYAQSHNVVLRRHLEPKQ